ncbi:hypothetical protein [Oerskovia paurometabola]|uniref:hypothetical protein n=1 Tax=Oerskovia paurometabola TaxID=162170 RepID=UPI003809772E
MTATSTRRRATLPTRAPLFSSLLDEHCAALAAEPEPNLALVRSALATGLRVGRVAAIATNMARLRDELADGVDDLREYCAGNIADLRAHRAHLERLEVDHAHYMWAYYALDLTEADVLTYCAAILTDVACLVAHLPTDAHDLIPGVRLDAAHQAQAALQGWTDRIARTGASL